MDTPAPIQTPSSSKLPTILLVISSLGLFATTVLLAIQNTKLQSQISSLENKINTKPKVILTPTPTTSPTNDPTSSWKKYSGVDFELKYPNSWNNLQSACQKITFKKSDAIQLELSMGEYLNQKIGSVAEVRSRLNSKDRKKINFQYIPKTDFAVLGPLGEGELDFIVVKGPEGTGYFEFTVDYVGPVPDKKGLCLNNDDYTKILSTLKFTDQKAKFCGGIAGIACPSGFSCKLDGTYPDAGGTCEAVK